MIDDKQMVGRYQWSVPNENEVPIYHSGVCNSEKEVLEIALAHSPYKITLVYTI